MARSVSTPLSNSISRRPAAPITAAALILSKLEISKCLARRAYYRCGRCHLVFVPARYHLSASDEKAHYDLHQNHPGDAAEGDVPHRLGPGDPRASVSVCRPDRCPTLSRQRQRFHLRRQAALRGDDELRGGEVLPDRVRGPLPGWGQGRRTV
jgi:hypothetical protein